jgi:hypothetical protein
MLCNHVSCFGYKRKGKTMSEYTIWTMMKQRCYNPNATSYPYYGAKGIRVCQRWKISFKNFLEDMGDRPGPEYTLERIDGNKDYYKENCKWATWKEQNRNHPNVKLSETQIHIIKEIYKLGKCSQRELADIFNISYPHINRIIYK